MTKAIESVTSDQYIPINKGHFELEPPERLERFKEILSVGWEKEYVEYRRLWEDLPQRKEVREYPLLVDLELSSKCNLHCPMCPTITERFKKLRRETFKEGLMDFALIKRIIDEVHPHIYSLRLSWVGEPTLHPRLIDSVDYAKKCGIKEVSFLTNGSKLHLDYMKKIIEAGLDIMTVSIDGMGDTYNRIRSPLRFDQTINKLTELRRYMDVTGTKKPLIKIQGVWPAIRDNPEHYYNTFSPLVDLIAFNPLIDYLHNDDDILYADNFSCPQPYQRVTVSADGRAAMCSNDDLVGVIVGDAKTQSIYNIWHGNEMNHVRELHGRNAGFLEIVPCRNCYYPRKVETNETALINGRVVVIENYVNRIQEIGK